MPAPVVLVHGAWHGPWCWERVTPLLEARGIHSVAVGLPTCDPSRAAATLYDDAASLATALDALDAPAVVVGHSYGGMVITQGAAGHPRARHLIYLCAFMPEEGESLDALALSAPNPDLFAAIEAGADQRQSVSADAVGPLFYNDCDGVTVAWAAARLRSMLGGFGEAITRVAWRDLPSTYIVCADDRAIPPDLQRRMAARAADTIEWQTSHSPFASQPALVADTIAAIAGA